MTYERHGLALGVLVILVSVFLPPASSAQASPVEQNYECGTATSGFITISGYSGMVWEGTGALHNDLNDYGWLKVTTDSTDSLVTHNISCDMDFTQRINNGRLAGYHMVVNQVGNAKFSLGNPHVTNTSPSPLNTMGFRHFEWTATSKKSAFQIQSIDLVPAENTLLEVANFVVDGNTASITTTGVVQQCR